jgi:anti-anti-sigma factor
MPQPSDYTHHTHLDVHLISLQLESLLGIMDVNRVAAALNTLVESGARKLVLDLQNVQYAGSAALGMLLGLAAELNAKDGKLVLANAEHIEPLLKVTRARGMFQIAPDVIKAMEMFRGE